MSTGNLLRWSGMVAVVGGVLLVLMGILTSQPFVGEDERMSVVALTPLWQIGMPLLMVALILILLALVGLYIRQAQQAGSFGLVAFGVAFLGTALVMATIWVFAFVIPGLAEAAPAILDADEPPAVLGIAMFASFLLFSLGWVLFGAVSLRARVFPRGAAILLILGAVFSLIVDMLPITVPVPLDLILLGAGVVWMGYSLWSERAQPATALKPATEY